MQGRTLWPTEAGTPQGGIISPVLANIALDGLELLLRKNFSRRTGTKHLDKVHLVRYADDGVPRTHERKCDAAQEMRVGPSKPAVRRRLQTTASCMGQEP